MDAESKCSKSVPFFSEQIKRIVHFVKTYRWIIDAYVSDFFVCRLWSQLPKSWQGCLGEMTPVELSYLLEPDRQINGQLMPLSLLAFVTCTQHLSLNRRPINLRNTQDFSSLLQANCQFTQSTKVEQDVPPLLDDTQEKKSHSSRCQEKTDCLSHESSSQKASVQDPSLQNVFMKHVKSKKQHEIIRMGQVISLLCDDVNCDKVVDVGAGLGHLSRLLSFGYQLKVTAIEAANAHAPKATKFDREVQDEIKKKSKRKQSNNLTDSGETSHTYMICDNPVKSADLPNHVTHMIYPDTSAEEFLKILDTKYASYRGLVLGIEDLKTSFSSTCLIKADDKRINKFSRDHKPDHLNENLDLRPDIHNNSLTAEKGKFKDLDFEFVSSTRKKTKSESSVVKCRSESQSETCHSCVHRTEPHRGVNLITCSGHNLEHKAFWDSHTQDSAPYLGKLITPSSVSRYKNHNIEMYYSSRSEKSLIGNPQNREPSSSLTESSNDNGRSWGNPSLDTLHNLSSGGSIEEGSRVVRTGVEERTRERKCFVLTGLHACGDLIPTLLRVFVNCSAATGLVSVGCCYMKLSSDGDSDSIDSSDQKSSDLGYPMSSFVKSLPNHELNFFEREMACHFADDYCQRLKDNSPQLWSHGYRAALQYIMVNLIPDFEHSQIKLNVKKIEELPFRSYVEQGLKKLGINREVDKDLMVQAESFIKDWRKVVAFYTLRMSLAPVVETLLLLDRSMYLCEHDTPTDDDVITSMVVVGIISQHGGLDLEAAESNFLMLMLSGIDSALVPIFDPNISPRNLAILAWK